MYFITFGDNTCSVGRERICSEAKDMNVFTHIKCYTPNDLCADFLRKKW